MFCKKCGELLQPKDGKMVCLVCGITSKEDGRLKDKKKASAKVEIMNKKDLEGGKPVVKADCEKCEHDRAYFWLLQTRSADEPETKFFKCCKCGHTWREYD